MSEQVEMALALAGLVAGDEPHWLMPYSRIRTTWRGKRFTFFRARRRSDGAFWPVYLHEEARQALGESHDQH